jgi:hypothetical protein
MSKDKKTITSAELLEAITGCSPSPQAMKQFQGCREALLVVAQGVEEMALDEEDKARVLRAIKAILDTLSKALPGL